MNKVNLTVTLDREIYFNQNGYRIVKCNSDEGDVVLVGHFMPIYDNEVYEVIGIEKEHHKYGHQVEVDNITKRQITETDKLIDYFSSGLFFGIGKKTAEKIVDKLGENAIASILEDKGCLSEILSERKLQKLYNKLNDLNSTDNMFNYLINLGINQKRASKLFSEFGNDIKGILESDPFILYYNNSLKYSFNFCKDVCNNLGIDDTDIRIVSVNLYRLISDLTFETGCTYVKKSSIDLNENAVNYLLDKKLIYVNDDIVTLKKLYDNEKYIANFLNTSTRFEGSYEFNNIIDHYFERSDVSYNRLQVEAVRNAFSNQVSIITGGPGTGKTTIIKAICDIYQSCFSQESFETIFDRELVLVAPTGRAAKRMNEQTLCASSTIHRYLKWDRDSNTFHYGTEENCKAKFLIIDEFSMVDINLFASLLKAIDSNTQIVILGDDKQLPAVGSGDILRDLLDSKKFPTSYLSEVYRQDDAELIEFMHKVRNFEIPTDLIQRHQVRNFIQCQSNQFQSVLEQIVSRIKNDDIMKYQILIPMYKGVLGIDKTNILCQNILNPKADDKKEIIVNKLIYRVGDKVLITQNFPNHNVYNGDIGFISNVNVDGKFSVEIHIDDRKVVFKGEDVYSLTHGYAISIHKSQGSEFDNVIIPIFSDYYRMLRQNLIYTAITRTKKTLLLVGEVSAFENTILKRQTDNRQTLLASMLGSEVSPYDFI